MHSLSSHKTRRIRARIGHCIEAHKAQALKHALDTTSDTSIGATSHPPPPHSPPAPAQLDVLTLYSKPVFTIYTLFSQQKERIYMSR